MSVPTWQCEFHGFCRFLYDPAMDYNLHFHPAISAILVFLSYLTLVQNERSRHVPPCPIIYWFNSSWRFILNFARPFLNTSAQLQFLAPFLCGYLVVVISSRTGRVNTWNLRCKVIYPNRNKWTRCVRPPLCWMNHLTCEVKLTWTIQEIRSVYCPTWTRNPQCRPSPPCPPMVKYPQVIFG
jgi:hypothetical protein